jgi:hypothetical protein
MEWAWLWPWRGAAVAFLLALGWGLAAWRLRRPRLAALAAGIGVLAGWWVTFGLLTATPRQLPERLPLLALGLVLLAGLGGGIAARWRVAGPALAALGAIGVGWWMAGAPRTGADLSRAAPVLAGIAGAALLLALRVRGGAMAAVVAGALLGGLAAAAAPGPGVVLGAAVLGAALGALGQGAGGPLAALPLAGAVAALGALPLVARGAPADWAGAAAPLLAALAGPLLARWLPARLGAAGGAALAATPAVAISFFLR